MPIFIICSLTLFALVQSQSQYLSALTTDEGLIVSISLASVCFLGGLLKKLSAAAWQDGFAVAVMLVWFGYWRPMFNDDTPMFHVFPLYYAVISGWLTLAIISKSLRFDAESVTSLRYLEKLSRLDSPFLAILLGLSLLVPDHYLLYPTAMTLFLVRFTMVRCLEIIDSEL